MYTILYTTGPWYDRTQLYYINSVVPGRSEYNFDKAVFSLVSQIDIFTCSYHNALRWIHVASFTKKVNQWLAKRPLRTNGHLANRWLTSLVKEATGDLTYEKSTLVQVMAWCCQATSSYQSQCWPRPLSPFGITRPCLNELIVVMNYNTRFDATFPTTPESQCLTCW